MYVRGLWLWSQADVFFILWFWGVWRNYISIQRLYSSYWIHSNTFVHIALHEGNMLDCTCNVGPEEHCSLCEAICNMAVPFGHKCRKYFWLSIFTQHTISIHHNEKMPPQLVQINWFHKFLPCSLGTAIFQIPGSTFLWLQVWGIKVAEQSKREGFILSFPAWPLASQHKQTAISTLWRLGHTLNVVT